MIVKTIRKTTANVQGKQLNKVYVNGKEIKL
jgi:hypothetical protein